MISGKGIFIWRADMVLARLNMDMDEVVMVAKNAGIRHVIIKIADGRHAFPIPSKDPTGVKEKITRRLIEALRNAGISVWGFSFVYGTRIPIVDQAEIFAQRAAQFGITEVSRCAFPPQHGHSTFTPSVIFERGLSPVADG